MTDPRRRQLARRLAGVAFAAVVASSAFPPAAAALVPSEAGAFSTAGVASGSLADLRTLTSSRASTAYADFVRAYWNPSARLFWAMSDHSVRTRGRSRYADFWWSAELWEVVMDRYEAAHDPAARKLIDTVWDGMTAHRPTLASDYNDDRNWWALGATRAYRLTGERRFLEAATKIFNEIWSSWDGTFGGGIWWRRSVHDQKNVATNAAAAITAAHLYQSTGNAMWLDRATRLFRWVDSALRTGDRIWDHVTRAGVNRAQYTYNYGTYLGAAATLNAITHARAYLTRAVAAATRAVAVFAPNGVLRSEGTLDGGAFRGIFLRSLTNLAVSHGQRQFLSLLSTNASVSWSHRSTAGLSGADWTVRPSAPIDAATESSGAALLQLAIPAAEAR